MTIFIAILGAVIGSFLSVCIFRIPLLPSVGLTKEDFEELGESDRLNFFNQEKGMTINSPSRSLCPKCKNQLLWWHNIPIISWVALKGRCFFCKAKISARYPFVEALTALGAVCSYQYYGSTLTALVIFIFIATMIVISFIDYDLYIIPNVISYPGTLLGIAITLANSYWPTLDHPFLTDILDSLLGILAGAGFLYIVALSYKIIRKQDGLGMGDVKLLALVGALFGPEAALFTIFAGSLIGSVAGLAILLLFRKGLSHPLPFGPYLAAGAILYLFVGAQSSIPLFPPIFHSFS